MSTSIATRGHTALFRFEGALSPRPTLTTAAWLGLNGRRLRSRLLGLSSMALWAPLNARDPHRAAAVAWATLEGMSDDRLAVLGDLYAEEHLDDASLSATGLELLRDCQRRGQRIIFISDNLDVVVRPVAARLGVEDVICNTMELDEDAKATGALRPPVFGPQVGGSALRDALAERGVTMATACGYGSHGGDSVLLAGVALPCAVTPDRELRRIARDLDWPVVEAR